MVHAAPEHEAALLGATLDATIRPDLSNATILLAPTIPLAASATDGCHHDGRIRIMDDAFRFEEEREEAGCAELRTRIVLPQTVDRATVSFVMDRTIHQASSDATLQLPIQVQQRLNVYDDDGSFHNSFSLFPANEPHRPIPETFEVTVRTADLGPGFILGWYFEDTGNQAMPLIGPAAGRQVISTVRDIQISAADVPVRMVEKQTRGQVRGDDAVVETITADLRVLDDWTHAETTLAIDFLELIEFRSIVLPNGTEVDPRPFPRLTQADRNTVFIPDAVATEGGVYRLVFEGLSTLPPDATPAPPTRLEWLVWTALAVPVIGLVGATWNHALLTRDGITSQRRSIHRKHVELVLLVIGHVALTVLILRRHFDDMAVLPLGRIALLFYGLLGVLMIGYLLHWGIGVLRRRHARDLRQAEALRRINEDLARSNRDLERFAYVASHDLQEPLRKVMSFTGLLQKRYGAALDDRAAGYIDHANDAAARARALISDLLAFSRVGSSEPKRPVDLQKVVGDVLRDLGDDVREAGAQVDVGGLPTVPGSEGLLRQLFTNLIGNAIKYRDPGRPLRVGIEAHADGRRWRIDVADNGLGIDGKHQDRVFEIFQRVHTKVEGSGIGLAICKRIAEFHGGDIHLRSAAGKGATFSVLLPMK